MSDSNWFSDLFIEEAKAAKTTRENMSGEKINNQDKTLTENGEYTFDEGYTGLGVVTVDVPEPDIKEPVFESLSVTENGLYTPPEGVDGYDSVTVNVASSGGSDDGSFKAVIERTATEVTLPSDLTKIGDYAFYYYTNLALTSLPSGLTKIGANGFRYCSNLSLTSLPDGVIEIGDYAFGECYNLAISSLPAGLTSIGKHAFRHCSKLAVTSIPYSVTYIGQQAFQDCKNLAITSIPAGVSEIGSNAFSYCTGLTEITFKGKPNIVRETAFNQCGNLFTINVPWAEGEVANAPWGATNATINYNYVPQPPADKYSWDAVLASIDAGTYATDYAIGDTVPLDLGSEGVINMQIAAFDTDDLADGSGKAPITWISQTLLSADYTGMNPALATNDDGTCQDGTGSIGGWEKCHSRYRIKNTIKPLIPETVCNSIKPVTKTHKSFDTAKTWIDQTTADDVWIPSKDEVVSLYSQLFFDDSSRIKSATGFGNKYWGLRSTDAYDSFDCVSSNGLALSEKSEYLYFVPLCFCT